MAPRLEGYESDKVLFIRVSCQYFFGSVTKCNKWIFCFTRSLVKQKNWFCYFFSTGNGEAGTATMLLSSVFRDRANPAREEDP